MHDIEVYVESALADLVRAIRNGNDFRDEANAYRKVVEFGIINKVMELHAREKDGTCSECIDFSNERHITYARYPCSTAQLVEDLQNTPLE